FLGDHLVGEGTGLSVSTGRWKVCSSQTVRPGTYRALRVSLPKQHSPLEVDQAAMRWAIGQEFGREFVRMQPEEQVSLPSIRIPAPRSVGVRQKHACVRVGQFLPVGTIFGAMVRERNRGKA
ncbi:MAG: hypothetical protein ACE5MM_04920, partial [Nitrospiraceae bacterium]